MKRRNRKATEESLIAAVGEILAENGLRALNADAVAKKVGVHRALIYRYFDSFDGLIERFAKDNSFWPTAEEIIGGDWERFNKMERSDQFSLALKNLATALEARPLTQQILIWELIEDSPIVATLEKERESIAKQILSQSDDEDVAPASALLTAGVIYLLLRSRRTAIFNAVDLQSQAGWNSLYEAIRKMSGSLEL